MKKTWIALLLALCMLTALGSASACCGDDCYTIQSAMDEKRVTEGDCACTKDGMGDCPCAGGMCGEDCMCMDGMSCMKDGMTAEDCACERECVCEDSCACVQKKLEMLQDELNAVFEANRDLWDRFFGMMDKQPDMDMDYADYLTEQLEMVMEKLTEAEYKLLQQDIEAIRRLDAEMAMLEEKLMPDETILAGKCMKDGKCVPECPCEEGTCTGECGCMKDEMYQEDMAEDTSMLFPTFEGMDLDGNPVTSELFKENSVTVVNFWFSTCAPCIAELGDLSALNEKLMEKGGEVIGVNADTIGGDEKMIAEAKRILEVKGAAYRNIYFPADSEAGQLTYSIMSFPTTVVVDRSGRVVGGQTILGGINNEAQMKALQALIDEALMNDMMKKDGM